MTKMKLMINTVKSSEKLHRMTNNWKENKNRKPESSLIKENGTYSTKLDVGENFGVVGFMHFRIDGFKDAFFQLFHRFCNRFIRINAFFTLFFTELTVEIYQMLFIELPLKKKLTVPNVCYFKRVRFDLIFRFFYFKNNGIIFNASV